LKLKFKFGKSRNKAIIHGRNPDSRIICYKSRGVGGAEEDGVERAHGGAAGEHRGSTGQISFG
jgi:hypothetical protein